MCPNLTLEFEKMKKSTIYLVSAIALAALSNAAHADTLLYSFTEGASTFSFETNTPPVITASDPTIAFVSPITNSTVAGAATAEFFIDSQAGGVALLDSSGSAFVGNHVYDGAQLFTGTVDSPTLLLGTFTLTNDSTGAAAQLVVTDLTAAVPEPSTWAMMILGFFGIGTMTYRRRKSAMLAA
jgi:hypothetical protein